MAFLFRFCQLESEDNINEKDTLQQENEELSNKLTEMEDKFAKLNKMHSELQQETDKSKRESDKLKDLLQEYKDTNDTIKLQLNQYENWLNKSNQKRKELQNIINDMKKKEKEKEKEKKKENEMKSNSNNNDTNSHSHYTVLNDTKKRQRSMKLLSFDNNEFIKFMKNVTEANNTDKIWAKCDENNNGKIENKDIRKFLSLLVIFYKLKQNKQQNKHKNIDNERVKEEIQHLYAWIMVKYGQNNGNDNSFTLILSKNECKTKLVSYLQAYVDAKGM
eukprot:391177_1